MKIVPVACLEDNYAYLIIDETTKAAAAVDPVEPEKVLAAASEVGAYIDCVLTTHHHCNLQIDDQAPRIWGNAAPLKCKIFLWLLHQRRLPTNDRRFRHQLSSSNTCPSCTQIEDTTHLFLGCSRATQVWDLFFPIGSTAFSNMEELWDSRACSYANASICTAITWNIWKRRNAIIFNGVDDPLLRVQRRCLEDIRLWANRCHASSPKASLINWDHAGGNEKMRLLVPGIKVYGGSLDNVKGCTDQVENGTKLSVGKEIEILCLHTPCHTKGHISYYLSSTEEEDPAVFTGDTLFIAGCGRFFEGTAEQMYQSLCVTLGSLPKSTRVYCGHEYTVKNLQFMLTVEPENEKVKQKLEWAQKQREANQPTVPSTIGDEFEINTFMRVDLPEIQAKFGAKSPIEALRMVRNTKDTWKDATHCRAML